MPNSQPTNRTPKPHPICAVLKTASIANKDLAAAISCSPALVSLANRGLITPSARYRRACAAYLGVDEGVLFNLEDEPARVTA